MSLFVEPVSKSKAQSYACARLATQVFVVVFQIFPKICILCVHLNLFVIGSLLLCLCNVFRALIKRGLSSYSLYINFRSKCKKKIKKNS